MAEQWNPERKMTPFPTALEEERYFCSGIAPGPRRTESCCRRCRCRCSRGRGRIPEFLFEPYVLQCQRAIGVVQSNTGMSVTRSASSNISYSSIGTQQSTTSTRIFWEGTNLNSKD